MGAKPGPINIRPNSTTKDDMRVGKGPKSGGREGEPLGWPTESSRDRHRTDQTGQNPQGARGKRKGIDADIERGPKEKKRGEKSKGKEMSKKKRGKGRGLQPGLANLAAP